MSLAKARDEVVGRAPQWLPYLLLAIPFVVAFIALNGLTRQISSTGSSDEFNYHYATIRQFLKAKEGPDLINYDSATPPLYHLVMTGFAEIIGTEIARLRIINMLISFGAILVFYRILLDRLKFRPQAATVLSLTFLVSPYVFAPSFLVMTDNFGLLFGLAAIYTALGIQKSASPKLIGLTALFIIAATLTRQTYVWLIPFSSICLWRSTATVRTKALGTGLFCLSLIPLLMFIRSWGGLVPPKFISAHQSGAGLGFAPTFFLLSLIGIYSLLALPNFLSAPKRRLPQLLIAIGCAMPLLFLFPIFATESSGDGYVWFLVEHLPNINGLSALFLLLIPVGIAALISAAQFPEADWAPYAIAGLVCLVSLPNRIVHQRYLDPIALLIVIMLAAGLPKFRQRVPYGAFVLMGGFLAYAVSRQLFS